MSIFGRQINIPFVKFTPELPVSINDSVISSKLRHHKDHIWWEEQVSTNVIFTGWATLCGCFYDSSLNTYLFIMHNVYGHIATLLDINNN